MVCIFVVFILLGRQGRTAVKGTSSKVKPNIGSMAHQLHDFGASWFISLALSSLCLKRKRIIAPTSQGSFYGLNKVMYTNSFAFRKNSIKISCNYQALVLSLKVYLHLPWS